MANHSKQRNAKESKIKETKRAVIQSRTMQTKGNKRGTQARAKKIETIPSPSADKMDKGWSPGQQD